MRYLNFSQANLLLFLCKSYLRIYAFEEMKEIVRFFLLFSRLLSETNVKELYHVVIRACHPFNEGSLEIASAYISGRIK